MMAWRASPLFNPGGGSKKQRALNDLKEILAQSQNDAFIVPLEVIFPEIHHGLEHKRDTSKART